MAEFASKGVAGAGLGLGIAGTALGLLSGGGTLMNAAGNGYNNYNCGRFVTKDEFQMGQELARKDAEIALIKSEQNTEVKIADVYAKLKGDMLTLERNQSDWNAAQMVSNAQMSSAISTNAQSIAGLQNTVGNITKTVIPNNVVCPGWGNVTVEPTCLNGNSCGCNGTTPLY